MSKGIDIPIDELVGYFNTYLWTDKVRSFYGRVFRTERDGKISPEVQIAGTEKYVKVLKDTAKHAQCFFDVQPNPINSKDIYTADIWLCMMVNLSKLYPSLSRAEAQDQVQRDVMDLLMSSQFEVTGITGGEGFTGYDWGEDSTAQAKADMSPNYLFKYILQTTFINS